MLTAAECRTYDGFVQRYQRYVYPLLAARVRRLRGGPLGRVLDLGTGPGYLTVALARSGGDVVAGDINPAMLEMARRRVEDAGLADRVAYAELDVHALPFADDAFDVVVSYSCLHHWADPEQGLRECRRVLAPDGLLLIVDTDAAARGHADALAPAIPEPELFRFVAEAFEESLGIDEVDALCRRAGVAYDELGPFSFSEEDLLEAIDDLDPDELPAEDTAPDGPVAWQLTVAGGDDHDHQ